MTCIDKLIGIKDPCDNTQFANYLDSIGVTLQELDQYYLQNNSSGKTLFNEKKAFAWKILHESIFNHLGYAMQGNTVTENSSIGYYEDNSKLKPAIAGKYTGIEIESCNPTAPVSLFVSTLKLNIDFTGMVNVLVFDLNTNQQIDTIQVDAVAGVETPVIINKTYRSQRQHLHLAFVYDSQPYQSNVVRRGFCGSCSNLYGFANCSKTIKARGIESTVTGTIISNIKHKNEVFGMFIDYSLQCDYELWACGFANKLVLPLMYLIGAELINYAIESSGKVRNNNAVMDIETNIARRDGMMMKYHEHLNMVIKHIQIPEDYYCFKCRKPFIYT
jgi:hypothetical protein